MRLALDEVGEDEVVVHASGKRHREKFAEPLGGTISVESEAGKGSTFTVRVPVEYADAT